MAADVLQILKAAMNLIGMYYARIAQLITKYNFDISIENFEKNNTRLINQLWKLIPMRENNEDWQKQLDTVILEIAGLGEIFYSLPHFLQLLSKLEGIKKIDLSFEKYRKVIFECINLLGEMKNEL